MTVLHLRHRPCEIPEMKHHDVVGQLHQASAEVVLEFCRERGDRGRQLAGDAGVGERAGQAKKPEPRGRQTRCDPAEVTWSLAGEHIAQEMIIDDDRVHSGRGEIWVIEAVDEPSVIFCGEGSGQKLLASARRQENHGIAEVDHRQASTLGDAPPTADGRRHRHLPAAGHEEFCGCGHDAVPFAWCKVSLPSAARHPGSTVRRGFSPGTPPLC